MNQSSGEVWRWNKEAEMDAIRDCLKTCSVISIDTEFPGCLKETPMEASEETRYRDMRFNVHRTKLIQLGFTLLDGEGSIAGTWEVNFSDFNESKHAKNEKSIAFLRTNGLDLEKIREEGVGIDEFFREFAHLLEEKKEKITWVTFQGSYDKAYLVKALTGGKPLPDTSEGFAEEVERLLGDRVYDVKTMAEVFCGLSNRYGLQRIADELEVSRVGKAHHAGSDSELTMRVFDEIVCNLHEEYQEEEEEQVLMTRCYIPQPPPILTPLMVVTYPSFGGYFVVPGQGMNYV